MVERSAMSGSVAGNSAWSMSSLRWAGDIQFLSGDVSVLLFLKLTASMFQGYVRGPERKARSDFCPPARARASERKRHQGRPARGPAGAAGSRRQLPADARVPR